MVKVKSRRATVRCHQLRPDITDTRCTLLRGHDGPHRRVVGGVTWSLWPRSNRLTDATRLARYVARRSGLSAWQLSLALGIEKNSASSALNLMAKRGKLTRVKGDAPGGGYGYYKAKTR